MKIRFLGQRVPVPRNRLVRIGLGLIFVLGGIFSFLPFLGVWMLPLGFMIWSIDFPPVRRLTRRFTVRLAAWLHKRYPKAAARLGRWRQRVL